MTWALIYWILTAGPYDSTLSSTNTVEFNNEVACNHALVAMHNNTGSGRIAVFGVCVDQY